MDRTVRFREYLADCRRAVGFAQPWGESGRLTRVAGLVMEAVGLRLPIGSQCLVQVPGGPSVDAEVVGFSGERLLLMPATDVYGVMPGAHVVPENPLAAQPPRELPIYGSDISGRELARTKENLQAAKLPWVVKVEGADVLDRNPPADHGVMVTNPPYGVRLEDQTALQAFYPKLGHLLKQR